MKTQQSIKLVASRITCLAPIGLAALFALLVSAPAKAQSRYNITDLGTLPGLADSYVLVAASGQQ
jgi:hypothetical protein